MTPPKNEDIISLWEKTPVKAHFYRFLAFVFLYIPIFRFFTWNSLREKMRFWFRSHYLEVKKTVVSNTNKKPVIPKTKQPENISTINEIQAPIPTNSTTETEIKTTNPADLDQTNVPAAKQEHESPKAPPRVPTPDYTPQHSDINSDFDEPFNADQQEETIPAFTEQQTDMKPDSEPTQPETPPHTSDNEHTDDENEDSDSDTSSITTLERISIAGSSDDESEDDDVVSTELHNQNITATPLFTDVQTNISDTDTDTDTHNPNDEVITDNNLPTHKKTLPEVKPATTPSPQKPTIPLFMKSGTELQSPEVIIQHFTAINIGDKAQKIVTNLSNNFLSQEQLHRTLIKDAKLSLDPKAVTTLKTNITDIVTKLIQTLLTEPQKLGPTLKKNVSDTLIALLALNQNNGIDLISYKKFAENLALFVPPFVLALFKQCVPAATDLSEKVFDKLDTSVSEYVTSITSDLNSDQCLKTRANALEKSMTQLKTSANNLGTLLNEAITDSEGKKNSLLSTLFPLYRYMFKGSTTKADSRTKRFITEYNLDKSENFKSSRETTVEDTISTFFYGLTPHIRDAPENGIGTWRSLMNAAEILTKEDQPAGKQAANIQKEICQFVQASNTFHSALFFKENTDQIKSELLTNTEQSKIATIYRIAANLFSIREHSIVEPPNPEKTYQYIKLIINKEDQNANKIAESLIKDPLSIANTPKKDGRTSVRTAILKHNK